MKKNWLLFGIAAILIGLLINWFVDTRKNIIYIAVMAPLSGTAAPDGEDTVRGVKLFAEQYNAENPLGFSFEIVEFDDGNSIETARAQFEKILAEDKYMLIIGHSLSSVSIEMGELYKDAGIPAISGSATSEAVTKDNEWYFRVVPNSGTQSVFAANYMYQILGHETAAVIYDVDAFGVSLAEAFVPEFEQLGGTVSLYTSLDRSQAGNLDARIDEIVQEFTQLPERPEAIFYATHASEGVKLITVLKREGLNIPSMGASAFSNVDFMSDFEEVREEKLVPGIFSDGVYAIAPVIFDVAGVTGQEFRESFLAEYGGGEPGMKAATNYDALKVAAIAMRRAGIMGDDDVLVKERQMLRDALADIDTVNDAVEGVTGTIFFDAVGDVARPAMMTAVYETGYSISAPYQLQPILNLAHIIDLTTEIASGRIVEVGGKYLHKTIIVYTGIDINEVSNLDIVNSRYTMDFYIWFRYLDEFDSDNIEFINADSSVSLGEPLAEERTADYIYRAYRVKGTFTHDFEFESYPFDAQDLVIQLRHKKRTRDDLIYVRDMVGMRGASSEETLDRFVDTDVFQEVTGWEPVSALFYSDIAKNDSTLGNPKFFGHDNSIEFSRFSSDVRIRRNVINFSIKNLLPLGILMGLSYLIFYFPIDEFGTINGIIRGVLMTVAFFHLKLASDLPGVDYLVALDYVFYILYALFTFELAFSLITNRLNKQEGKDALVKQLFFLGRVAYPTIILVSITVFWMLFVR